LTERADDPRFYLFEPEGTGQGPLAFAPNKKKEELKMTKAELIEAVCKAKSVSNDLTKKSVTAVIDATFTEIKKAVKKDERFAFPGFGTWNKKKRAARTGRNPQTGQAIKIKAQTTVTFKPAQDLKNYMGGKK
jgi:DNA-binding protein HU-beta